MNLILPTYSIFLLIILNFVFFTKKRLRSDETKTYSILIILSTFNIIFNTIGISLGYFDGVSDFLYALNHFDLPLYFWWSSMMYVYLLYVYMNTSQKRKSYFKIKKIILILNIFITILTIFLPFEIVITKKAGYAIGPCVNLVYLVSGIYLVLSFITSILLIIKKQFRKIIPLFSLIILGMIAAIIQKNVPSLIIIPSVAVLVEFIMYFTIENPDMKTIEEIHKAKEISDNANEEKTLFLYNMTNEIRGITKDINKEADNILDETDNKKVNVEVIEDSAREIKGSTAKFTTITNEILDVSNMDGASIRVYDEKYNIKLILKSLINTYKKRCDDKNIVFRSNINSDMPEFLYGDGINLKKVIDILLDNSVKYTNDGYVELDVNTIIKNDIVRLIITVEDSGIGIDSDKLGGLFVNEKDYKEENYDLNDTLYNVKKIITLMNGTIVPSSIYGTGTKMKIILDQRLVVSDSKLNEYEKVIDKKDVLLIGNLNSKIIKDIVKDKNINLEIIELGKEALDKIRGKKKYDLILIEDNIKPLSGIIIMKKLLMIKSFNTKVILLSSNNEYIDNYDKYGFSDVISEPIDEDIFINKINKYLER